MIQYRFNPLPVDDSQQGIRLILSTAAVDEIARRLPKQVRGVDHENVLYVAGISRSDVSVGLTVVAPRALTEPQRYDTDVRSHAGVIDFLGEAGLEIVAQVHSHPGPDVYHSDGDDDLAFVLAEGFWSIVVPSYGRSGFFPLRQLGVHCYSDGAFRLLTPVAAEARVSVAPAFVDMRGL